MGRFLVFGSEGVAQSADFAGLVDHERLHGTRFERAPAQTPNLRLCGSGLARALGQASGTAESRAAYLQFLADWQSAPGAGGRPGAFGRDAEEGRGFWPTAGAMQLSHSATRVSA